MNPTQKSISLKAVRAFLVITCIGIMASCSSDNGPNYRQEFRFIDSISIPDTVKLNKDYDFEIYYKKQSDCDEFAGFNAVRDGDEDAEENSYIVSAIVNAYDRVECQPFEKSKVIKQKMLFRADKEEPYHFKFLQGIIQNNDEEGHPLFIKKTVYVKTASDSTETE